MLIAALIKQAGSQVAQGLKHAGRGAPGGEDGSAFAALKGAITSGGSSSVRSALGDVRKQLASAGSIHAASSVQNRLSSVGASVKSANGGGPGRSGSSSIRRS